MDVVNELPRRLRARREGMGYSLQTIAARCQLAPQELEAIERGERAVHLVELERLSWTLGVHPGAFLAESAPEDDARLQAARFRAQQGAELKPDDRRLLSIASEAGRIGQFLWDLLHRPAPALRVGYTPIRRGQAPWKQGYDLGASARERLSPRAEPIPNLALLIESLGVHIARVEFQDIRIEAATVAERGAIPVILLNLRSPRVQRPGTCQAILAHELCHVLHDGNRRHNPLTSVSFAHEEGGEPSDQERRANGFAPAFLAPARFLDLSAGPEPLAVHLVETWGFSMEGAAWHTKNLLNLSTQEKQLILRHLQSRGWREALVAPPEPAWRISSGLVAELAREAQRQELISEGRLQEILEMS